MRVAEAFEDKHKEDEADGADSSCETLHDCLARGREKNVNEKAWKCLKTKLDEKDMTAKKNSLDILSGGS